MNAYTVLAPRLVEAAPVTKVLLVRCRDEAAALRASLAADQTCGTLILPVVFEHTAKGVLEVGALFGVPVTEVDDLGCSADPEAQPGRLPSPEPELLAGQPIVLALGDEAVTDALRFGALTGRVVLVTVADGASSESLWQLVSQASSVTVACPRRWDSAAVHGLQLARRQAGWRTPVGFLFPFGEDAREAALAKGVLFGALEYPVDGYRFLYPLEGETGSVSRGNVDAWMGPIAEADNLLSVFRRPAAFTFATPHSNGVNMSLGPVVVCAKADAVPMENAPVKVLPCFQGAPCTRSRPGVTIVPAATVQSLVTFWYTCWGVLLDGGTYDPRTSLAHEFALSPFTAALVTTPALSLLDRAAGLLMADLLRSGTALGAAVDAVNAAHFQRYRDTPEVAILFGDPELVLPIQETVTSVLSGDPAFTRFAARTQLQLYPSSIQPPAPKPDDVTDAALEVAVSSVGHAGALDYARCVAIGSRGLPDPVLVEAAARLGRSADLAWATSLTSYSRAEVNERGRTQDRVVALAARDVAVLQDAWQAYAVVLFHRMGGYVRLQTDRYYMRHRTLNEPLGCPVCGGPANRVEMRLPTNQTSTRLLIECVSCATVLDAAVPLDMSRLVIAGSVTVGKSLGAVLEWSAISSVGLGGVPIRAVAVLEPFAKSVAGQPTMVIARGVTPTEAASSGRIAGELRLPDLIIPADTPCGVHYLNVLLLIGAIPAVIRTHVLLVADPKLTGPAPHGAQPAPLPLVEIT